MKNIETGKGSFAQFLVIWSGQLASSIGIGLTGFALGVHAYQKTQTATAFSLIILCSFLPSIMLRPVGGMLADRFDRRLMMIIGDLGSATGIGFIVVMLLAGGDSMFPIYAGVAFSSVFASVQNPAYKASVTDLLTEEQFSKASGLVQLAASSQYLFAPVIAGFLLGVTSIVTVLLITITTFVLAVLSVLCVKKNMPVPRSQREKVNFLGDFRIGWRAISANRGVFLLVWFMSAVTFFVGFLQTLLGPMMLAFSDAETFGSVQSISASGMLVSSVLIGMVSLNGRCIVALVGGLFATGLFLALMGGHPGIVMITAAGFLFFCALPFVNAGADVLIRKNIANEEQGRAWGMIGVVSQLGYVAAYGCAGFLADRIFNPLLAVDGALASSVGAVIGVGPGRGIGFLFVIAGTGIMISAALIARNRSVRALETD